ncbi:23S rRNA (pseudouridine(1915)-N(3))-methyltransferase RlmH [Spiroplasma endosymbiont of Anurida maritima]|uniref:23S rRNA (pseudouridine(1915)-N(3))-methyltransferase RlmH n=1 Tax=Spiroplasma endosymbiont of Anurida maritima TaxID=2967972 RepID=UPI0036D408D4
MKIEIINIGTTNTPYYKEACFDYNKKISYFANVKETIIKEQNFSDIKKTIKSESDKIIEILNQRKDSYKILLDLQGQELDSIKLSSIINEQKNIGKANIVFIIGGSNGVNDDVRKICNFRWSLSKLTLPHMLAKTVLYEQIFRSFKIINNQTYHK